MFDFSRFKFDPLNVIETVGSILGEKDTLNETQKKLNDMEYPHIRDLLPFADYKSDDQFFINKDSIGFILEAQPLIGANELLADSLDTLLQDKVPRGTPLQVMMVSSRAIKEQIEYGLKDFGWKGHRAEDCNDITRRFYLNGAQHEFPNDLGHPLTLRDYRLFFTWGMKVKHVTETDFVRLRDVRRNLLNALTSADIHAQPIGVERFMGVMRELLNHDVNRLSAYDIPYDPQADLKAQMVDQTTSWQVKPGYIQVSGSDAKLQPFSSRMVSLNLDRNPQEHYLWQNGDILADLTSPTNGIPCPFVFSIVLITEDQAKSQGEATREFLALDSRVNTSYAKYIPNTVPRHQEWKDVRQRLLANQTALTSYFYGVTLFCEDNDDVMARDTERTKNAFAAQGLKFVRADFMQIRNLMGAIPFTTVDEKLWNDFKRTGALQRSETFHSVNLMPIIGDNKLSPAGLLIPSYRHQLAFLDVFDESLPNTNYNWFLSGTSGAGKSVLAQGIARQVLDVGGFLSIKDIGDSYKAFCHSVGGTYINGSTLKFNPFANITPETLHLMAERVRDQLCILASPNGLLDEVHESLILESITESWPKYQQDMRIDHVVDYLKKRQNDVGRQHSVQMAGRIDEIVTLLNKYTTRGIYGTYFNSSEPTLKGTEQFVVTEMGDLKKQGDLLAAVLFSMMLWTENLMYSTPRSLRKMDITDEGWKMLSSTSDRVRGFIEEGYRTARRHNGSYGTVTQAIRDKNLSTAALAAYDNSSFKFTTMQDAKAFSTFRQEEPDAFNELEWKLISKFPPAKKAKYSSFLVNVGSYSSFHRLKLDPLTDKLFSSKGDDFTYRERRLKEGADIKDILFEMAEHDPHSREVLDHLRRMEA
ncbi:MULTISPECIES: type IV secretion system protein TraC [Serratia]|uniref:type IV secretion system protein TraC n=1 Tax=Serratia TaxID=613 RepID=UPI0003E020AB|nr:type IV secretion system protein TraC [Serratia marcescens]BAO37014.1 conjugal transfer system protein TraC [Serratia marcescens SM39]HBQ7493295.1 type IV secretion system protein TraC [Klebsiella pneumoniae]